MSVRDSEQWHEFLGEQDSDRQLSLITELVSRAEVDEFRELVSVLYESASEKEKLGAVWIMRNAIFLEKRSRLLETIDRERLKDSLLGLLGGYPEERGARIAMNLLLAVDPESGERELLKVSEEPACSAGWRCHVRTLGGLPSKSALEKLRELAVREDEIGGLAVQQLKIRGIVVGEPVVVTAARWRESRGLEDLNRLYSLYIVRQENKPIAEVLSLLGTPDRQKSGRYWYDSKQSEQWKATLFLEADSKGKLIGMKLK